MMAAFEVGAIGVLNRSQQGSLFAIGWALAAILLTPWQVQAAGATLADCQRAVQGEVWSTGNCLATEHFTLIASPLGAPLLIERVDAHAILLTASTSAATVVGDVMLSGPVFFGPSMMLLVSDQYVVEHLDATALGNGHHLIYEGGVTKMDDYYDLAVQGVVLVDDASLESYLAPTPLAWYDAAFKGGASRLSSQGMFASGGMYRYLSGPGGTALYQESLEASFGSYAIEVSVQAVPEPTSWALMGLGLVGLMLVQRRQQS
jgi:PEP-CTERM motif